MASQASRQKRGAKCRRCCGKSDRSVVGGGSGAARIASVAIASCTSCAREACVAAVESASDAEEAEAEVASSGAPSASERCSVAYATASPVVRTGADR